MEGSMSSSSPRKNKIKIGNCCEEKLVKSEGNLIPTGLYIKMIKFLPKDYIDSSRMISNSSRRSYNLSKRLFI
jgi:hypothetical protein